MPTNHISAEIKDVGSKGSRKHWTKAEVEARQAAAEGVSRSAPVTLRVPSWLSEDARKIWRKV
jgi:phage terminase small subunit